MPSCLPLGYAKIELKTLLTHTQTKRSDKSKL